MPAYGRSSVTGPHRQSLSEASMKASVNIDHALAFFARLAGSAGVEIRTHGTGLYNSIYRFDDEMLVNPHVYGKVASHAPALHLRRLSAGDLFTTYEDSFAAVWENSCAMGMTSMGVCRSGTTMTTRPHPRRTASWSPSRQPSGTSAGSCC